MPAGGGRSRAELEYRLLWAELHAARRDSVYLVLDFSRSQVALKLRGAVLWSCPMRYAHARTNGAEDFVRRFMGAHRILLRQLEWTHLFAGKEKIPANVLEVVGKAINTEPSALQRVLPERLLISLRDRVFVDITTDVEGRPTGGLDNPSKQIERTLGVLLGGASLDLWMEGETALSLHGAAYPGMPVLLIPPPA